MKSTLTIATVAFFLALSSDLIAAPSEDIRRYRAESSSEVEFDLHINKDPTFPLILERKKIDKGSAVFAIYVNPKGELADFLLLEATRIEFAEAVEHVLPDWDYPVPMVDGEPAAIVSKITVTFKRGAGVVYTTSGYENMQSFFGQFTHASETSESYRTYATSELDSIPIPTHVEKPAFHIELLEERNLVNAVFEFYIDEEGKVRIPTLREADEEIDERLLVIAQEALLNWRFDPPKRNGKPVVARAAQPFRFKKKELTP